MAVCTQSSRCRNQARENNGTNQLEPSFDMTSSFVKPLSYSMTLDTTIHPPATAANYAPAVQHREAGRYKDAAVWLQAWLAGNPGDAVAFAMLAQVLSLNKEEAQAASALNAALSLNPALPIVQLNRARMLLKQQKVDEALQVANTLYGSDPQNHENLTLLAASLSAKGLNEQALPLVEQALHICPDYAEGYANRALVKLRRGDAVGALRDAEQALALKPHLSQLWGVVSSLRYQFKNLPGAIEALERGLEYEPDNVGHLVNLGELKRQAYQIEAAIAVLEKAVHLAPNHAAAWANLGTALQAAGRLEHAQSAYQKALSINPAMAAVANNLGILARDAESWEAALSYFESALKVQPDHPDFLGNKGAALLKLKRPPEEVEAVARKILSVSPDDEAAYRLLGALYKELGRFDDACSCLKKVLETRPTSAETYRDMGVILVQDARHSEAEGYLRKALELNPNDVIAQGLLLFIFCYTASISPDVCVKQAIHYGKTVAKSGLKFAEWQSVHDPDRLRIGIVSGDLCNHPVGYFLESLLVSIDPARVELLAYPTHHRTDDLAVRIKPRFAGWKPLCGYSDEYAARLIQADGVHVLLDLSGHTAHNRLPMFALKPAPVQASWLGYFATTGVEEMDYLIGDPYVVQPMEEDHFTESIWRLPETYLCFTPPAFDVQVASLPALTNGSITFGCFNNLAKMNDTVVALWARVLLAVPGSRLFLKTKQLGEATVRQKVIGSFAAHGIDAGRLILEGHAPRADLLAAYQRVDIALDPFPYPGGTTSVEGLWMGVPVITKRGDRFLSHVGETIAHNAGLSEWIAEDEHDYVAKAVYFASNLEQLAKLRAGLRQQVLASPLFDAPRFARHFEEAMWGMWSRWLEQQGGKS